MCVFLELIWNKAPTRYFVGLCLTVGLTTTGCSKLAEEAAEKAIEAEITQDGGAANVEINDDGFSMEFNGEDGKAMFNVGAGTEIPKDFPSDVPVYEGMTINMAHSQQQKGVFMVQALSQDSVEQVATFYEKETAKAGWEEESSTKQGDKMRMLSYTKDDRRLHVAMTTAKDGTNVTLNISNK